RHETPVELFWNGRSPGVRRRNALAGAAKKTAFRSDAQYFAAGRCRPKLSVCLPRLDRARGPDLERDNRRRMGGSDRGAGAAAVHRAGSARRVRRQSVLRLVAARRQDENLAVHCRLMHYTREVEEAFLVKRKDIR